MKNERILSYKMSQKLTTEEAETISAAAGMTHYGCAYLTGANGGADARVDVTIDL